MSKPHDGAEETFFVLGQVCVRIYDWNEHYIKEEPAIKNLIVFDVSHQKYYDWEAFKNRVHEEHCTLGESTDQNARKNIKRLKFKCYLPVANIPMKKSLKTKKKIENMYICTSSKK